MANEQQGNQDNSLEFLYTLLVIGVLCVGAWFLWRKQLSKAYLYMRIGELEAIDFILRNLAPVMGGLYEQQKEVLTVLLDAKRNLGNVLNMKRFLELTTVTSKYLYLPVITIIGGLGGVLCFSKGLKQFRLIFDTKSLRKAERYNWPQIAPVTNLDLVSSRLNEGPWAMASSPMIFCKEKHLLNVEQNPDGSYKATLIKSAAYRELFLQLGPVWQGVNKLPLYLKALFAIFAARMDEDKQGAERLLDSIALSGQGGSRFLDFTGTDELLRKHLNCKAVKFICERHAYLTSLLASMLEGSRTIGVLASAEFIWLKPLDRRMWYMLNSVGRITAAAEICGAFAHWLAEKKLGSALLSPMVDEAVEGLNTAIKEVIYKPDEEK